MQRIADDCFDVELRQRDMLQALLSFIVLFFVFLLLLLCMFFVMLCYVIFFFFFSFYFFKTPFSALTYKSADGSKADPPHARLRGLAPAILCFKSHLCLVSICVCCYLLCLCFLETHNSNKQYWNEITKQGWPPHARLRGRAPAQLLFDSHVRALLQFCVCLSFLSNTSMKQPMLKLNIEALPTPHARISHFSPAPHCECCVF